MWTYFPIKDHLVSFSVFDLVVEVLRQLQAFVNLSLKPDRSLSKKRLVSLEKITRCFQTFSAQGA